jgi:FKBP-type peptidyl-prolyl cis-trans isomerase (trigger factor)
VRREEAEAIYDAGREAVVEALLAPAQVEELTRMIDALRERVEELERQLSRNSRNSSMPPSADPPMTRQQRRALARQMAKESLREQGAQPGHEGRTREMASPERVDERFEHLPHSCSGCGHDFNGGEERLGDPLVHQEWELPPISPVVFEHRLHRLRCPGCGKAALAELPAGVSVSAFGPRLEAHVATLAGVYRLSRRQVADVVREVFGIPISTGAVDKTIMRMSRVLADPGPSCASRSERPRSSTPTRRAGAWPAPSSGCGSPPRRFTPATGSTPPARSAPPRSCSARTSAAS